MLQLGKKVASSVSMEAKINPANLSSMTGKDGRMWCKIEAVGMSVMVQTPQLLQADAVEVICGCDCRQGMLRISELREIRQDGKTLWPISDDIPGLADNEIKHQRKAS